MERPQGLHKRFLNKILCLMLVPHEPHSEAKQVAQKREGFGFKCFPFPGLCYLLTKTEHRAKKPRVHATR
jgi:hypothetical protein